MTRILATVIAAATLGGAMAPAALAQGQGDPQVEMLTGKVYLVLRDCDLDANDIDARTMAQVAGISLAASSVDSGDRCQQIKAIARGD